MNRFRLLLLWVASAPMAIQALPVEVSTAVTDANAAVPMPKHQSAYADYKPIMEPSATPDKVWVAANRQVPGQSEQGSRAGTPSPAATPTNVAKPAADAHKKHDMNKKGQ
nr:hypothetical protein [uncultured Duganella sp.]